MYAMVSEAVTFEFPFYERSWDKFSEIVLGECEIVLGKCEWEECCLLGTAAKFRF